MRFTEFRCDGEHQGQNKDNFQRWLFKIIELRLVSPSELCVLQVGFPGLHILALAF